MEGGKKLKMLCLHGYRQNGEVFRAKCGAFRKALSKSCELTFLTAPHAVAPLNDVLASADDDSADPRGWWFNGDDLTFKATTVGGAALGFDDSVRLVADAFRDQGPFDGLFGFSQGASFAALLAAMHQKGLLSFDFRFVVAMSGFCSGSLVHKGFYDEEISMPSLHVYGDSDKIIPKEMSETLAGVFAEAAVVEHSGGHYVACSSSHGRRYRAFLAEVAS